MRAYEVMYILKPDLEEEQRTQIVERINSIVTDGGGEVAEMNPWGLKRLAYEIDDYREGYYVVLKFQAEHAVAREMDRVLKITDGVLRHMILRLDQ